MKKLTKAEQIVTLTDDVSRLRAALYSVGKVVKGMQAYPHWYSPTDLDRLVKIIGDALAR